jgi:glycerate dehydrogenase
VKIVVLDGHTLRLDGDPWSPLAQHGEVTVYERSSDAEVLARAHEATVLITNKAAVTAEVIAHSPVLRLIAVTATGYDCVDLAAARKRGILVANVPEYGTASVAQFVFAQLLELCHHVALHDQAVRAGEWTKAGEFSFWKTPLIELAGKVLGIVGFGRIGRGVGELAHAFGMKVLAQDQAQTAPPVYQPFAWADLDTLFREADVITLHCPLTLQTAGMIDRQRLQQVKPGAFLINAARGALIVEKDLAEALNTGGLAGAAVDVAAVEPIPPDSPLLRARNCLITPHIAWATNEARRRLLDATVANIRNFLAGRPTNVVN